MDYNGIYVFRIPSPSSPRSSTPAYGVNGCLTLVEEANGRQDLFMVDPGEWTVDSCVFMDSKRIRHQSCPKAVKKYPLHIMESQGLTKMRFSSKKTDRIG